MAHAEALRKLFDGPRHSVTGERIFNGIPFGASLETAHGHLYLFKWVFGADKKLEDINFGADIDTYTAALAIGTDTPYQVDPVTITDKVGPPAGWGELEGTVTDAVTGAPISDATVQLCAGYDIGTGACTGPDDTLTTGRAAVPDLKELRIRSRWFYRTIALESDLSF